MSAPSVTEQPFITETNERGTLLYKVNERGQTGGALVAAVHPSPAPWNPNAWHIALFDPFSPEHAGAEASETQAKKIAEMFARTAARAVTR